MKKLAILALLACSCSSLHHHVRYSGWDARLNDANYQDRQLKQAMDDVRKHDDSATAHNDLGRLFAQKGYPIDALHEFQRSVDEDSNFYPAWYNLGVLENSLGDERAARHAFARAIDARGTYAPALFQLGLLREKAGDNEAAVDLYAKAFRFNHAMLDVHVNPAILDSQLVDMALLRAYPKQRQAAGLNFEVTPSGYVDESLQEAPPSPQAPASKILTPAAPVTDPAAQPKVPQPPPPVKPPVPPPVPH